MKTSEMWFQTDSSVSGDVSHSSGCTSRIWGQDYHLIEGAGEDIQSMPLSNQLPGEGIKEFLGLLEVRSRLLHKVLYNHSGLHNLFNIIDPTAWKARREFLRTGAQESASLLARSSRAYPAV